MQQFGTVSTLVFTNSTVDEVEEAINNWSDRTSDQEKEIISIAVKNNNIELLNLFQQYFDYCFDRRCLMHKTNNIEVISFLANIEYDQGEIKGKINDLITKGCETDLQFFLDNLKNPSKNEINTFIENAAPFNNIQNLLYKYFYTQ